MPGEFPDGARPDVSYHERIARNPLKVYGRDPMKSVLPIDRVVGRFPAREMSTTTIVGHVIEDSDGTLIVRLDSRASSEFWLEITIAVAKLAEAVVPLA
jgi:hypothetical protein